MPRGDKPTTTALALKDGWIYEDALPANISAKQYDSWFKESLVLDGVRMGPPLREQTDSQPLERQIDFSCRVCGVQCDSAPDPPAHAVCPNCGEDHDYRYERELRGTYCYHCGQQAPEDWYDD